MRGRIGVARHVHILIPSKFDKKIPYGVSICGWAGKVRLVKDDENVTCSECRSRATTQKIPLYPS